MPAIATAPTRTQSAMPAQSAYNEIRLVGANPRSRTARAMAQQDMSAIRANGEGAVARTAEGFRNAMVAAGHSMGEVTRNEAKGHYAAICSCCGEAVYVKGGCAPVYSNGRTIIASSTACTGGLRCN